MSASVLPAVQSPVLAVSNVAGSLGTTLAGLAAMAPQIAASVQSVALPTSLGGWMSIALGILAMLSRA